MLEITEPEAVKTGGTEWSDGVMGKWSDLGAVK
jgi:hypothetical protein